MMIGPLEITWPYILPNWKHHNCIKRLWSEDTGISKPICIQYSERPAIKNLQFSALACLGS